MKNLTLILVVTMSLVGCASADKLSMPKGKWQPVNQAGFIPSTAKRYVEGVDVFVDGKSNEQANPTVKEI